MPTELCIHQLFVLTKVLRVPPSNPLTWQLSFTGQSKCFERSTCTPVSITLPSQVLKYAIPTHCHMLWVHAIDAQIGSWSPFCSMLRCLLGMPLGRMGAKGAISVAVSSGKMKRHPVPCNDGPWMRQVNGRQKLGAQQTPARIWFLPMLLHAALRLTAVCGQTSRCYSQEEPCPICFDSMCDMDVDWLVWCSAGCGRNIHGKCMRCAAQIPSFCDADGMPHFLTITECRRARCAATSGCSAPACTCLLLRCRVWAEHQSKSLGKELSCPLCRGAWGELSWRPPPPKRRRPDALHQQQGATLHLGTRCGTCKQVGALQLSSCYPFLLPI